MAGKKFDGGKPTFDQIPCTLVSGILIEAAGYEEAGTWSRLQFSALVLMARDAHKFNLISKFIEACQGAAVHLMCYMDSLGLDVVGELNQCYLIGANLYDRDNWKKFEFGDLMRFLDACQRHIYAAQDDPLTPNDLDAQRSGLEPASHLAHALWQLISCVYIAQREEHGDYV